MARAYTFVPIGFDDPSVVALINEYRNEVVGRESAGGRELDMSKMLGTSADATSDQMAPPNGVFLGVFVGDLLVGGGGVRVTAQGECEVKRMYVQPGVRGAGIARSLLGRLEAEAVALGCTVARLDTRSVLTEARALYTSSGYVEVDRYNDNPFAQHWFEKQLID